MRTLSIIAAVVGLTSASMVSAAVQFTATDLGSLGGLLGARGSSVGSGLMVAGTSSLSPSGSLNAMTAVVGGGGSVTLTPYPGLSGGANSYGMGIGGVNGETLVGYAQSGNRGPFHAITASGGGAPNDLHPTISGSSAFAGSTISQAVGINAVGDVVGHAKVGSGYQSFYLSGTDVTAIPYVGVVYTNSLATAVNDNGLVVGFDYSGTWNYSLQTSITGGVSHAIAYSWDSGVGTTVSLGTLPGGADSIATAVNLAGDIVGQSTVSSADNLDNKGHAFIYSDGVMSPLAELAGGVMSIANDINDNGDIVGSVKTASGYKAFIYQGGQMVDLNTLLSGSGWLLTEATSINDDGYITGYGTHNGTPTAFLLSPIAGASPVTPEPASVALLGLGAVAAVARRRRA
jgi:probable HAF family extracellular repeat protein